MWNLENAAVIADFAEPAVSADIEPVDAAVAVAAVEAVAVDVNVPVVVPTSDILPTSASITAGAA